MPIRTDWKQWHTQGRRLANTERGLFRNDATVQQLLVSHLYYICVHIYARVYARILHISPCTRKEMKSITAQRDIGKCEILPPESPDLSAYTLGYLRTVSKGGKGEERKKGT